MRWMILFDKKKKKDIFVSISLELTHLRAFPEPPAPDWRLQKVKDPQLLG